ncbi:Natural cytotoxicity triggering receptor 3 ligand 1 [Manis javanica]|nr:Natural cytotoxicity triggering receptor 3 ligand 1 [Manis javanica]
MALMQAKARILPRLPLRAEFLPSQCIWGRDTDVVVTLPETLRNRLPLRAEFLPSQCIWGRDTDVVVTLPETLRKSRDTEKEKTDPLQHSLAPMPTRGQEKCTLDGTLNPNTLMQLDLFCKQVSKWAEVPYVQALLTECIAPYYAFLISFSYASLSHLPHRAKFLTSQCIWGLDSDRVVKDPETLRKKRRILSNTAWPQ